MSKFKKGDLVYTVSSSSNIDNIKDYLNKSYIIKEIDFINLHGKRITQIILLNCMIWFEEHELRHATKLEKAIYEI